MSDGLRMRLTIVSDVCYPTVCDGVASILTRTIEELLILGHEIQLIAPEGSEMPGVELVTLKSLPITEVDGQVMPLPSFAMFSKVKLFNPDVILFMDPRLLALQTFLLFRLYFGKKRLVATFHTDNFKYMKIHFGIPHFVSTLIHRFLMNSFSQVISVSSYAKRILMNAGVKTTTGLWSGGVDTELFHPKKRDEGYRREILKKGEETIALYVGRVSKEKGIDRLETLFRESTAKKVRWLIVGDGDDKAALEAMSKDLPVTFVGKLQGEELAKAYASSDFFVFPSQTDTFGLVLIEAMASGLPVIAFDHGGVLDIINNDIDGIVIAPDASLLDAFNSLLLDEGKNAIGQSARQSVESTWGWLESTNKLMSLIREPSDLTQANLLES